MRINYQTWSVLLFTESVCLKGAAACSSLGMWAASQPAGLMGNPIDGFHMEFTAQVIRGGQGWGVLRMDFAVLHKTADAVPKGRIIILGRGHPSGLGTIFWSQQTGNQGGGCPPTVCMGGGVRRGLVLKGRFVMNNLIFLKCAGVWGSADNISALNVPLVDSVALASRTALSVMLGSHTS